MFGTGIGNEISRATGMRAVVVAAGLVCATLGMVPALASGASSLGVDVTRDQLSVNRGDEFVSYKVRVKNTAAANPATGTVLTCQTGSWTPSSGSGIPALTYQWLRDGSPIASATSATYTLAAADQGRAIQCQVTATNSAGASVAVAAPAVAAPAPATAPPAPNGPLAASARPTITPATPANVGAGVELTCNQPADWSGSPTYTFQWLANGAAIAGATNATYTTQAADMGKVIQCVIVATNAGGAASAASLNRLTTGVVAANVPANAGAAANPAVSSPDTLTGTTALSLSFPDGARFASGSGTGWNCQFATSMCTTSSSLAAGGEFPELSVSAWLYPDAPDAITATFTASGGGAPFPAFAQNSLLLGPATPFGLASFTAQALDAADQDYTQAGGHPVSARSTFKLNMRTNPTGADAVVEELRDFFAELPVGFVGNLNAMGDACQVADVTGFFCPPQSSVGVAEVALQLDRNQELQIPTPVYRVVAEPGYVAAFAFAPHGVSNLTIVLRVKVRSTGDYGVTVSAPLAPQSPALSEVRDFTFCGYGTRLENQTGGPVVPGRRAGFLGCKQPTDSDAREVPLFTNPTECSGEPPVTMSRAGSWQNPGALNAEGTPDLSDPDWKSRAALAPLVTGCESVPFDPSIDIAPTTSGRDSATGLDVDLQVPQDGLMTHDGIATSHLKKTVVELPDGLTVNPSAATGLEGCSDAQIDTSSSKAPACPDGSKLGTVEVHSPLVDRTLSGVLYLGTPKSTDPASGEMLRLWLVVRDDVLGVSAKLPGNTTADPATGKLVTVFDQNPRLPFDHLKVDLKGGGRGVLATPQDCGEISTKTTLTPWSGTGPVDRLSDTAIDGDCSERFAPKLAAGSSDDRGRGQGGTYSFKFSREDGEQWLRGLTAKLPKGLLASVKDVPLCSDAAAGAGNCPASSKIGIVDAKAGSGDPFVLEQKGEVFLTQGYKGGEYGLTVKIRPVAGPFRGDMELSPIIVRQAIHVDRTTAQVTAISDPFPLIHHGIPLRTREVTVLVNRPGFMLNPSDCDLKQSEASLLSDGGATANLTDPFQVSGCASLPFKPRLTLALTGRRQVTTGKHPGIKAVVTQQGTTEAGIEQAVVRLPKSLALDPNNAQALCEFADGTKPDLENHCPKGSIVGRARAKTPLLEDDLVGNVYFVKNVRRDPTTGNEIRTLPMIIVALRGEIAINLKGESSTTKAGKLVNTFASVPDAPITQFNLNINGGSNGILAVTRTRRAKINLCAGRHIAETDMDGHNGRRHDTDIRMKTPCTKRQVKKAKRAARSQH
jgi:hypothetical protein